MKIGHLHLHSHKMDNSALYTKAHLLESLEQLVESKVDAPQVTSEILDGKWHGQLGISTCSDINLVREQKIQRNTSNMGCLEQHVKRCT